MSTAVESTTPPGTPGVATISEWEKWCVVGIVFSVMGVVTAVLPAVFVVIKMVVKALEKMGIVCTSRARRMRRLNSTKRRVRFDASAGGVVIIEDEDGVISFPEDIETVL